MRRATRPLACTIQQGQGAKRATAGAPDRKANMREIHVNGVRVRALRCLVRNAYSYPHAYVLDDGSYLSRGPGDSACPGAEHRDDDWLLQRKHHAEAVPVIVRQSIRPRESGSFQTHFCRAMTWALTFAIAVLMMASLFRLLDVP